MTRSHWDESGALTVAALRSRTDRRPIARRLMKYNLSEILIDQGRYDEAEPLIREVIRLWRASGADGDVAEGQRELARLLARRGDIDGARPLLEAARAYQYQTSKQGEVLRTDARIAEMLLIAGAADEALVVIDGADHLAASTDGGSVLEPTLARLRGWALLQSGRAVDVEAERSFETALDLAQGRGEALEEALTLDGLASLRRDRTAISGGHVLASGAVHPTGHCGCSALCDRGGFARTIASPTPVGSAREVEGREPGGLPLLRLV